MPEPKPRIGVVCGIIERNETFLAARRGPQQTNSGLWEFPGGKIHDGESPQQALGRELREELCIDVVPLTRLPSCRHDYPWISIELIPFTCIIDQGEPCPQEHDEIRWVTLAEAGTLSWCAADIPVLKEYTANRP